MKKFILVIPILIVCSTNLFPQWSTDPNNNLIVGYGLDPHICSDSAGGCYVTYDYNSTFYPRWLAVERLDKYGYKPWGINKRILGESPEQSGAEIIEDGEGGVIVSYIDRFENLPNWTQRVRVQRVDSNGNFLWAQTGVRVSLDAVNQGLQQIISDGIGGCVVTWKTISSVFYVNRISANGERLWSDSGKVLGISNYSGTEPRVVRAADGYYYVETGEYIYRIRENGEIVRRDSVTLGYIVPDSEGGIVLSGRVWTGMIPKLVAQRKDSLGNKLWQEPYVEIADSLHINTVLRIQASNGYYYFGWSGTKDGIAQLAQFQALRQDGSKLFPQGSLQISENSPIGSPLIIPSDSYRTIFIWNDATTTSTTIAQLYDTLGNKLWNENGIIVSYPAIAYETTFDDQGGFITMGPINEFTIVAQQVSRNGNLGEIIPVPVELISFITSAAENKVTLNWITATELNNYGFEVERKIISLWEKIGFVSGFGTTAEPKSYSFIDENITTGIYKYRLKQIDFDGSFEYSNEIEISFGQPYEYILRQNYPNPFNSSTIIKYQIPKEVRARISLYNILGEKILTLYEGEQKAGEHEIKLTSNDLPSGNYFYSIETDLHREVKKLTILK